MADRMTVLAPVHKFSVEDFYKMHEAGIIAPDLRVELIEGEIVEMTPIGSRHVGSVHRLTSVFGELAAKKHAVLSVQNPLYVTERFFPQPDVQLLKPSADEYSSAIARPGDVLLLIEVADSSLNVDRLTKIPLYARAEIPEVWLVDLVQNRIEVYRRPEESAYTEVSVHEREASVSPQAFPDIHVSVADIVG